MKDRYVDRAIKVGQNW